MKLDLSDASLNTDGPLTPAMNSQTATRLWFLEHPDSHDTVSCWTVISLYSTKLTTVPVCNDPLDCIGHDLGLVDHHGYVGLGKRECGTSTKWSARNSPPSLGSHECHLLGILSFSIFVLGNRRHEERCCFPTAFNVQVQLQTLCIRCLFDSSKNKPLEHYTHNALLALAVFFTVLCHNVRGNCKL